MLLESVFSCEDINICADEFSLHVLLFQCFSCQIKNLEIIAEYSSE